MGHIIERVARERGHEIVCIIDKENTADFDSPAFRSADCVIEFSTPATALQNIYSAFRAGVPVVCGTTGWLDSLPRVREICEEGKATFLYASNFSVGVNIFMAVNRQLARIMERFPQYLPSIAETHHIHKLDHPSGTAISLAEDIVEADSLTGGWKEPFEGGKSRIEPGRENLPAIEISHERRGEVPGIHTVIWDSPTDTISITHSAKSREGFALGAVIAAEWLASRKGFHTIDEVFDFK